MSNDMEGEVLAQLAHSFKWRWYDIYWLDGTNGTSQLQVELVFYYPAARDSRVASTMHGLRFIRFQETGGFWEFQTAGSLIEARMVVRGRAGRGSPHSSWNWEPAEVFHVLQHGGWWGGEVVGWWGSMIYASVLSWPYSSRVVASLAWFAFALLSIQLMRFVFPLSPLFLQLASPRHGHFHRRESSRISPFSPNIPNPSGISVFFIHLWEPKTHRIKVVIELSLSLVRANKIKNYLLKKFSYVFRRSHASLIFSFRKRGCE